MCIFIISLVITVRFSQSAYSVEETTGVVQPLLVLSNPASIDITVEVSNTDKTARGEYIKVDILIKCVLLYIQ